VLTGRNLMQPQLDPATHTEGFVSMSYADFFLRSRRLSRLQAPGPAVNK
jgi:hypothetical protein